MTMPTTSITTALPLINGISNQLCYNIINYFTTVNIWTKQIFGSTQYTYNKDDLNSKERPALFCNKLNDYKNSLDGCETGKLCFEIHFNLQEQRYNLTSIAYQIVDCIKLIFMNRLVTQYCQSIMHGLFWIGKEFSSDFTGLTKPESIVKCILDYKVDLMVYSLKLQEQGFDITSPDEQIYQLALYMQEQISVTVNDKTIIV